MELQIVRGEKTARYSIGFSGGQISSELIDRTGGAIEGAEPRIISFSANFTPFEEGQGGEIALHLGRSIPFKITAQVPGAPPGTTREGVQLKSIGLSTKAALFFGKPVVLFDDGEEKITLKLTSADEN